MLSGDRDTFPLLKNGTSANRRSLGNSEALFENTRCAGRVIERRHVVNGSAAASKIVEEEWFARAADIVLRILSQWDCSRCEEWEWSVVKYATSLEGDWLSRWWRVHFTLPNSTTTSSVSDWARILWLAFLVSRSALSWKCIPLRQHTVGSDLLITASCVLKQRPVSISWVKLERGKILWSIRS